jgi:hypothetical protein
MLEFLDVAMLTQEVEHALYHTRVEEHLEDRLLSLCAELEGEGTHNTSDECFHSRMHPLTISVENTLSELEYP